MKSRFWMRGSVLLLPCVTAAAATMYQSVAGPALAARALQEHSRRILASDSEGAREASERAIYYTPENARALCSQGNAFFNSGRLADAEESFVKAVDRDRTLGWGHFGLAATSISRSNFRRGEEEARKSAEDPGYQDWAPLLLADAARLECRFDRCVGLLSPLLDAPGKPNSLLRPVLICRGRALVEMGRETQAEADFKRAEALCDIPIDLGLWKAEALSERALARIGRHRPDEAMQDLSEAAKLKPQAYWIALARGQALMELDRIDEAVDECSRSVALNPDNFEGYEARAGALLRRGNHSESVTDCGRALDRNPRAIGALRVRGLARRASGDYSDAARDWARALELAPPEWRFRSELENLLR